MRSVVASHGPGSNPRDNVICNAILLQSFPVLQIFGLQYLDRHRPPSSPKNLKFQNRSKTGPISHTGPKTSRAARDRPEPNPRRNQPSRHRRRLAGAAAATNKNFAAAARVAAHNIAPQRRNVARQRAMIARPARIQAPPIVRPAANLVSTSVALLARSGARPTKQHRREAALPAIGHRATICARLHGQRRDKARNVLATMRDGRSSFGRHSRDKRAASAHPARAMALVVAPPRAAALGYRRATIFRPS
ncbi:hypothetical protein F511_28666 [Dorcoceras hygrometricum]|uniref:Uncharacterized protein n=1 Tax=Dorcoceras hygrometricum TaxID=472368 RepID=A0A2Z7A9Q5_9LAMI|nr:hypothetical protein F511_28666 [Dorcoceras hygrometricum]